MEVRQLWTGWIEIPEWGISPGLGKGGVREAGGFHPAAGRIPGWLVPVLHWPGGGLGGGLARGERKGCDVFPE